MPVRREDGRMHCLECVSPVMDLALTAQPPPIRRAQPAILLCTSSSTSVILLVLTVRTSMSWTISVVHVTLSAEHVLDRLIQTVFRVIHLYSLRRQLLSVFLLAR